MKPSFYFLDFQCLIKGILMVAFTCLFLLPSHAQIPAPLPFFEDFETGQLSLHFGSSNGLLSRVELSQNFGPNDQFHLITHSAMGNVTVTNAVDIHVNMAGINQNIFFIFYAKELNTHINTNSQLWYSDDGGAHFTNLGALLQPHYHTQITNWQNGWKIYRIKINRRIQAHGLNLSAHAVIRMVTMTSNPAPLGGVAYDNISVEPERVFPTNNLPERTLHYYLSELEYFDLIDCGRIDCPPLFWKEGILDKDFWLAYPGESGKVMLDKNGDAYHLNLSTLPNESGYAVSAAALRFDASPWAAQDPDGDPAHSLEFSWKTKAQSLTQYDAVYISDNGGETYVKAYDFSENSYNPGEWQGVTINLNEIVSKHNLKFTDKFVVVFHHYTDSKIGAPGYAIGEAIVAATDPDVDPARFKSNNYPNPFQNQTNIEFSLPETSDIRLKILDTQGTIVQTITEQKLTAGKHTFQWLGKNDSGKKVSPGIYYYQLETAQGTVRKRLWFQQ